MIIDHIRNWEQYPLGPAWKLAFEFLSGLTADAEERKYVLDGESVFGMVMSYETKQETDSDTKLEAHRTYVDVQMMLTGRERIGWYPTHTLRTKTPYNPERDVEFFNYEAKAPLQIGLDLGMFACLLPQDAHMPELYAVNPGDKVKKVVVKIARDRLLSGAV